MELSGRTAVVTGAAGGIGRALCRAFLEQGANVVGVDLDEAAVARVLDELGAGERGLAQSADVADEGALDAVRVAAEQRFGQVDVICNNAGIGGRLGPTWELPQQEWDRVLAVNLRGVVNGIRAFVPSMVERGEGHVVNTASMAGILPMPFGTPYVATKHAVVGISSTLKLELARAAPGVGVAVLCPGWTDTGIASESSGGVLDGHEDGPAGVMARRLADSVRNGRSPDEVADAVIDAIHQREFWVLTHPDQAAAILPYWSKAAAAAGPEGGA